MTVYVSCRYLIARFTALLVYSFVIILLCLLYFCNSGTTISFGINKVLSYVRIYFHFQMMCPLQGDRVRRGEPYDHSERGHRVRPHAAAPRTGDVEHRGPHGVPSLK